MQPVLSMSTFIFLITVILCFVAGAVLLVYSRNKTVNNRWLAAYYISTGYGLLVAFLLYSGLITGFPWYHTYRTGYISGFLLMPFSFFYFRSLIEQKNFRPVDLVHFMPAAIFIIDFIPFYMQPAAYKLQQVTVDAQELNTVWNRFSQGWLGIGQIYVPLRIVLTTIYWILQVRMIIHPRKLDGGQNLMAENREVMLWVRTLCGAQVLFFLPYYLNSVLGSQDNFFFVVHTLLAISVSLTILVLIMRPNILYGLKGIVMKNRDSEAIGYKDAAPNANVEKTTAVRATLKSIDALTTITTKEMNNGEIYLSGERLTSLGKRVTDHMLQERSFLRKGCTSASLAAEMNMQPYILSFVINQVFKTNFNNFLNGYRVNHAKSLIKNGEARLLTLEGLSEQCGFNNRNSFTMAFKKHTGQTPSDFIKQVSTQ